MSADQIISLLMAASVGGLVSFAWSQVAFGNRLTRLETKMEHFEKQLDDLSEGVQTVAGRRRVL